MTGRNAGHFVFVAVYEFSEYNKKNILVITIEVKDPEREGYDFVGWYKAGDPGDPYDFEKPVEASFTLYAVW